MVEVGCVLIQQDILRTGFPTKPHSICLDNTSQTRAFFGQGIKKKFRAHVQQCNLLSLPSPLHLPNYGSLCLFYLSNMGSTGRSCKHCGTLEEAHGTLANLQGDGVRTGQSREQNSHPHIFQGKTAGGRFGLQGGISSSNLLCAHGCSQAFLAGGTELGASQTERQNDRIS